MDPLKELKQLLELVELARAAQTEYFKTRTQSALIRSKQLERQLDSKVQSLKKLLPAEEPIAEQAALL